MKGVLVPVLVFVAGFEPVLVRVRGADSEVRFFPGGPKTNHLHEHSDQPDTAHENEDGHTLALMTKLD